MLTGRAASYAAVYLNHLQWVACSALLACTVAWQQNLGKKDRLGCCY